MSEYMQLVITSYKEAIWLPYLSFCYAIVFAQLVYQIYLYTKKYLETYAPSSSIHTLELMNLSLLALKFCSVMFQEWTISSLGRVSNI